MGSSSSSRSLRSTAAKSPWDSLRTWCTQHRYLVLGGALGVVVLGVFSIGNPLSPTVVVMDESGDEEFSDLGLEEELPVHTDKVSSKASRSSTGFTSVTPVRPSPSADFADLTLNFGGEVPANPGVVAAAFEGMPQPSPAAPVWLAGTIETDDDITTFAFPSSAEVPLPQATGPILMPQ